MKPKALVLLSGGLDSRLTVKLLQAQMSVEAIYFKLPFGSKYSKNFEEIKKFCKKHKVKLNVIDCTKEKLLQEYLDIIRKPKFRRGTALNPCVDCKIFLLKKAKEFAHTNNFDIIATGEVLGQRPMSQHTRAFEAIEKECGLQGRILRPLSAKALPVTIYEKKKLVNRNKLLRIVGRRREQQLALAKKYKISYPSPAGGCLLCEEKFCERLEPLLKLVISEMDIELLKLGRHFKKSNIILGRNYKENKLLEKIFRKYRIGFLLEPREPGPSAFVKGKRYVAEAKKLIQKYSKYKLKKIELHNP